MSSELEMATSRYCGAASIVISVDDVCLGVCGRVVLIYFMLYVVVVTVVGFVGLVGSSPVSVVTFCLRAACPLYGGPGITSTLSARCGVSATGSHADNRSNAERFVRACERFSLPTAIERLLCHTAACTQHSAPDVSAFHFGCEHTQLYQQTRSTFSWTPIAPPSNSALHREHPGC
ncbi:hypothetical protein GQ42DRAFT_158561 [Ramicandelaber brevisporus]|nr:hypothetical protein GQ42DRAFT_158561 [Ramicandelaber brevisporus]